MKASLFFSRKFLYVLSLIIVLLCAATASRPAHAEGNTDGNNTSERNAAASNTAVSCLRKSTANARIVIAGDRATAYFTVPRECKGQMISLVSYTAPNGTDHKPYSDQRLHKATTRTFNITGQRQMSVAVPDCFFQVDLVRGEPLQSFSEGNTYSSQGRMLTASGGGNKPCDHPAATTTQQPTPPATPATVTINNANVNRAVANVKITDEAPAQTSRANKAQPSGKLPDTGPGELAAFSFGLSMTAGMLYAYRSRFDSMLAQLISRF